MNVSKVKAALLFLFAPARFNDMAVDYHEAYTKMMRERYRSGVHDFDREQSIKNNQGQVRLLRKSMGTAFLWVLVSLVTAAISGISAAIVLGEPSPVAIGTLQLSGGFLLLGATLWEITVEAQSASGEWLGEKVHNWLFRFSYSVGTYLLGVSVCWDSLSSLFPP